MKKIGIIGSGPVAKSLAKGFIKHGHQVMLGTRDIGKLNEWLSTSGQLASTGSFADAARFGDVIVLAVTGRAAVDALNMAGVENISGKTIIDTTNPIAEGGPEDGVLKFFTSKDESLMEILQDNFTEAHFVKAFNSVGNTLMVNPDIKEGKPTMFVCGNNDQAKEEVNDILQKFGWDTCDMGSAVAARAVEQLCIIWCIPGFLRNEWSHAFRLVKP